MNARKYVIFLCYDSRTRDNLYTFYDQLFQVPIFLLCEERLREKKSKNKKERSFLRNLRGGKSFVELFIVIIFNQTDTYRTKLFSFSSRVYISGR